MRPIVAESFSKALISICVSCDSRGIHFLPPYYTVSVCSSELRDWHQRDEAASLFSTIISLETASGEGMGSFFSFLFFLRDGSISKRQDMRYLAMLLHRHHIMDVKFLLTFDISMYK